MILSKQKIPEINLEAFTESKISGGHTDKLLIVVPTNRKLRDLKKKLIDSFKDEPISGVHVETITTCTTKLLNDNEFFIPLSEASASVLIKETTDQLKLNYFNSYSKGIPFGTLERIINVISEYKKHGISPADLLREADSLRGAEKNKAIDLAGIFELYSQKCFSLSAFELGDIYKELVNLPFESLEQSFFRLYKNCEHIIFDGFDEFTKLEIEILNLLSDIVEGRMFISLDYRNGNPSLFAHLDETYSNLLKKGFQMVEDTAPLEDSKFKNVIETGLFNENWKKTKLVLQDKVYKISVANRIEEVEKIARLIKYKIEKESVLPHSICLAFNVVGNYSNAVRDIFSKYSIPMNLTDRLPLKSAQPVIAAVSILNLAENDFYYHDLLRVLSNKLFSIPDIDIRNIAFTANNLKITRGIDNWLNTIHDAISLLQIDHELPESEKRNILKSYKTAAKDIQRISEIIKPVVQRNSKKEFLSKFRKILLDLKLPQMVLKDSSGKEEEFIKSLTVFLNTLEEVLVLINPEDPNRKYPLHFFMDHIRTIANWARFNIKEKSDHGVLVTSINEIRGLKFDYLFLGGMCDGDFPTKYSPEIFNTGSYRKKEFIHQTEERYHFYQSLCCWKKELYLSIPGSDAKSELVESTFVSDFEKVIGMSKYNDSLDNTILSREDLQISFADNFNDKNLKTSFNSRIKDSQAVLSSIANNNRRIDHPFSKNKFSGYVGENEFLNSYLKEFSEKQFSISQLETYAKCPYKYYAERILRIKPLDEPTEEIEPVELGLILHSVLYEFYQTVIDGKISLGIDGTEEFEYAKNLLFEIAENKISGLNLNSPMSFFEKEKILGIEGNYKKSLLYEFLKKETENNDQFKPFLLEHEFGKFHSNENTDLEFIIGKLKLRGKIDRIDVDHDNKLFNVVDYKLSGRKPSLADLENGISLQLPVYLIAAKKILDTYDKKNYEAYRMIIYSLDFRKNNFGPLTVKLSRKRKESTEEIRKLNEHQAKLTSEALLSFHNGIKEGNFNLSELDDRDDKICRFCDFQTLCRVREIFGN